MTPQSKKEEVGLTNDQKIEFRISLGGYCHGSGGAGFMITPVDKRCWEVYRQYKKEYPDCNVSVRPYRPTHGIPVSDTDEFIKYRLQFDVSISGEEMQKRVEVKPMLYPSDEKTND